MESNEDNDDEIDLTSNMFRQQLEKYSASSIEKTPVSLCPSLSGYLLKLVEKKPKAWLTRFCVLKDQCLYIFRSLMDFQAESVIVIPSYSIQQCEQTSSGKTKPYTFILSHAGVRSTYLAADSEDTMKKWVHALNRIAQNWQPDEERTNEYSLEGLNKKRNTDEEKGNRHSVLVKQKSLKDTVNGLEEIKGVHKQTSIFNSNIQSIIQSSKTINSPTNSGRSINLLSRGNKQSQLAHVYIPGSTEPLKLAVTPYMIGRELFNVVCSRIGIVERFYFGLSSTDSKDEDTWVDMDRKVLKQELSIASIFLRVRIYPVDVSYLILDSTVKNFYLHERDLIKSGILNCDAGDAILLAALALQEQLGDYTAHNVNHSAKALAEEKLIPNATMDNYEVSVDGHKDRQLYWTEQTLSVWADQRGMLSTTARRQYLTVCSTLHSFGVQYFNILNKNGTPLLMGVHSKGVSVYRQDNTNDLMVSFSWNESQKASLHDKKVILKMKNKDFPDFIVYSPRLERCKRILLLCVDYNRLFLFQERNSRTDDELVNMNKQALRYRHSEGSELPVVNSLHTLDRVNVQRETSSDQEQTVVSEISKLKKTTHRQEKRRQGYNFNRRQSLMMENHVNAFAATLHNQTIVATPKTATANDIAFSPTDMEEISELFTKASVEYSASAETPKDISIHLSEFEELLGHSHNRLDSIRAKIESASATIKDLLKSCTLMEAKDELEHYSYLGSTAEDGSICDRVEEMATTLTSLDICSDELCLLIEEKLNDLIDRRDDIMESWEYNHLRMVQKVALLTFESGVLEISKSLEDLDSFLDTTVDETLTLNDNNDTCLESITSKLEEMTLFDEDIVEKEMEVEKLVGFARILQSTNHENMNHIQTETEVVSAKMILLKKRAESFSSTLSKQFEMVTLSAKEAVSSNRENKSQLCPKLTELSEEVKVESSAVIEKAENEHSNEETIEKYAAREVEIESSVDVEELGSGRSNAKTIQISHIVTNQQNDACEKSTGAENMHSNVETIEISQADYGPGEVEIQSSSDVLEEIDRGHSNAATIECIVTDQQEASKYNLMGSNAGDKLNNDYKGKIPPASIIESSEIEHDFKSILSNPPLRRVKVDFQLKEDIKKKNKKPINELSTLKERLDFFNGA